MKTKKELLKELFENDEKLFNTTIEELDSYNGYLSDNCFYEMELLNEFYHNVDPIELLQRAYFGRDENYYTDSRGEKIYSEFNPNKDYFTYNGYGNLISCDYKDYSDHLDDCFLDSLIENYEQLYLDDIIIDIIERED